MPLFIELLPNTFTCDCHSKSENRRLILCLLRHFLLRFGADIIKHDIREATSDLASYEKVKAFVLLEEGLTIENGMLTATLKLRKNKVIEKHRTLIDTIYKDTKTSTEQRTIVYI